MGRRRELGAARGGSRWRRCRAAERLGRRVGKVGEAEAVLRAEGIGGGSSRAEMAAEELRSGRQRGRRHARGSPVTNTPNGWRSWAPKGGRRTVTRLGMAVVRRSGRNGAEALGPWRERHRRPGCSGDGGGAKGE